MALVINHGLLTTAGTSFVMILNGNDQFGTGQVI